MTFLVVRDGREAIGCGALLRDPRGWGEVKRMFVRPEQRGRGIGKRVLAELEAIARDARLPLLRLETGIHNADALALYRRAGFVECAPFGDYTPDPLSVFMEKRAYTCDRAIWEEGMPGNLSFSDLKKAVRPARSTP